MCPLVGRGKVSERSIAPMCILFLFARMSASRTAGPDPVTPSSSSLFFSYKGESWWTTYRYQLEVFVDLVRGRTRTYSPLFSLSSLFSFSHPSLPPRTSAQPHSVSLLLALSSPISPSLPPAKLASPYLTSPTRTSRIKLHPHILNRPSPRVRHDLPRIRSPTPSHFRLRQVFYRYQEMSRHGRRRLELERERWDGADAGWNGRGMERARVEPADVTWFFFFSFFSLA